MKRSYMLYATVLLFVIGLSSSNLVNYYHSKLTLFDEDKLADNFRHMDRIFNSNPIAASTNPVPFSLSQKPIADMYRFKGKQYSVNEFLQRSETTGFLVIQNDQIIHERYFKDYDAHDRVTSFSVAKSFIATLVGIALDDGLIQSLSDPITTYVPELKESGFHQVPIVDILQMSSGIDFSEHYDDTSTDAYTIYDKMFIWLRPIDEVINDYGSTAAPGELFHYASINTQALGMLIENVFGKKVHLVMQERLWKPMGATESALWLTDQYETEVSLWGLNATLRDFARLGLLHLHEGRINNQQIISKAWVQHATKPNKPYLQAGHINQDWGYQYHWWIPRESKGDYTAIGIWGQFIYVNPSANLVIVKTSADANFKPHEYEAITAFRAIAKQLKASGSL
ncbi:serine hydrolase [Oceaniserpentilla sp. 4NH20-0058]|uniref:serine hydrolase domain-containing protein n=1 Tax=Oceaniserpentilla sp. 4NH20-0058 TaxID=3127660 RepID=UPI00310307E6